jgi:large subunit ribosomal protein L31
MKQDIHPEYRPVVFKDVSTDFAFLGKSTVSTEDTIEWEDGNEYPLVKLEISSASHPFYTGKQMFVDTAGRVDKFYSRYGKTAKKGGEKKAEKPKEAEAKEAEAPAEESGD